MTDVREGKGSCLCGAVKILVKELKQRGGSLPLWYVRKWTGGPLLAVDCGTGVSFDGQENISEIRPRK